MGNTKLYKWRDLTDKDKEYLNYAYNLKCSHEEKCQIVSKKFGGISHRTVRRWWEKIGVTIPASRLPKDLAFAKNNKIKDKTDILLITSAQNRTLVNDGVLSSMKEYAKGIEREFNKKVQIVVCPTRYRNPTTLSEVSEKEDWWDSSISEYLFYDNIYFGDVLISALSRVQPTAKIPLTGLEALAGDRHFILGHPKYQMKVSPRFKDQNVHIMTSTGSVTVKNYSDSKAGEHGDTHHVYGFVVVEKDDEDESKCLVPRFVNCTSSGDFYDLGCKVVNGVFDFNTECDALIMGDIHCKNIDNILIGKTKNIFNKIKPKNIFLHDILDGSTVNPHEEKDLYIRKIKIKNDEYKVEQEIEESLMLLKDLSLFFDETQIYAIESNHDVFIDRWVNNFNWKKDLHNSEAYLKLALIQQNNNLDECGNIFGFIVNDLKLSNLKYIPYGKSIRIHNVLCSMHGDFGVNGSKGSSVSLGRLPVKTYSAHLHSHTVFNGSYIVGVSCKLDQYYNRKGLSTWSQGHGVIYPNGKRQQIIFTRDYKLSNFI